MRKELSISSALESGNFIRLVNIASKRAGTLSKDPPNGVGNGKILITCANMVRDRGKFEAAIFSGMIKEPGPWMK